MAILHRATIRPTKVECLGLLLGNDPAELSVLGAYRVDDPDGRVGVEGFVVATPVGPRHAVLTYRAAPVEGVVAVTTMEHSVLGPRWIYDAALDPVGRAVLRAAVRGELAQAVEEVYDGDTLVGTREPTARILARGGAGTGEVRILRDLPAAGSPSAGLVVTWDGGSGLAVVIDPAG